MGDATTDEEKKVIVTAYEEVPPAPRSRPAGSGRVDATSSTATRATKASSASVAHPQGVAGARYSSNNRRALLLAYAQQLRRCDQRGGGAGGRPRVLLEWGKWKAQGHPGAGAGAGANAVGRRRSWCSRFRLWTRAFLRRVRRIGENALCKNKETNQLANVGQRPIN